MTPAVFVADTNVVVAGLISHAHGSPVARVLDAMLSGALLFLLSPALLDEHRAVSLRPKLVAFHGLTEREVDRVIEELAANAMWREPGPAPRAPDRGDDHLWALLHAHSGSLLVSGDRVLLQHPPSTGSFISPRTCLDRFQRSDD